MTSPFHTQHAHPAPELPGPVTPTGGRRLHAATETAAPRSPYPSCHRCGRGPAHPLEAITMTAQWLIATPDGPQLRRHCPDCTPAGPVTDLTCTRCGDGPLLAGDLAAHPSTAIPEPARAWLITTGWQLTDPANPTCPNCSLRARH